MYFIKESSRQNGVARAEAIQKEVRSMYPTIEDIRKIAAKGQYKRVPVCREVYADRYTPVEAMRTLRKASRHCYLLESASQTEVWGRYSFLGYEPTMEITCTDGLMKIRHTEVADKEETVKKVMHPGDTLREILREYKSPVIEEMPPFTGGLVGYFSYDYIKYSEPKLKLGEHEDPDFRDMDLMLFDQVIAFDHYRQKVLLITGVMLDDLENSYQKAEKKLAEVNQAYEMLKNNSGTSSSSYNSSSNNSYTNGESYSSDTAQYAEIRRMIQSGNNIAAETRLNSISNRNAEWYFLYGMVMLNKGWFDAAINNLETACRMDPNNFEYRQNLNNLRMRARSYTNTYRTTGGNANAFDCCINLWCLDSICECMGGDLIGCC